MSTTITTIIARINIILSTEKLESSHYYNVAKSNTQQHNLKLYEILQFGKSEITKLYSVPS